MQLIMAVVVNRGLVLCLENSPALFSGFIACRRSSNPPFPFSSVSASRFCSSSAYTPLRAHTFHGRSRSWSSSSHVTPALAVGPDPSTNSSESEHDQGDFDVLEQLGIQRLGNKEKKELRAYAHGLGTKLNVQHVGKLGVSLTVVNSISEALEANEILKVKVLDNCSSDMSEIITQLERGTRGQVVGKIGRTVLLYRASQRKAAVAAAAEKRSEKTRPRRK